MSDHGWSEFLGADGVDTWMMLHGGATAVRRRCSEWDSCRGGAVGGGSDGRFGSGAVFGHGRGPRIRRKHSSSVGVHEPGQLAERVFAEDVVALALRILDGVS